MTRQSRHSYQPIRHEARSHCIRPAERGIGIMTATGAIYIGPTLGTTTHSLHAYKLYVALHGEFDLLLDNSRAFASLKGIVIAPDRPHRIAGRESMVALCCIVPETPEGILLSRYHGSQEVFAPPPHMLSALTPYLRRLLELGGSRDELTEASESLVQCLLRDKIVAPALDTRVVSALEYMRSSIDHRMSVAEVASKVGLSSGRLEHLFSAQVGIPMSRYMTWYRLHNALKIMQHQRSLTEVAHAAGFADLSHLGRTFRRMLGLSPSAVQQHIDPL